MLFHPASMHNGPLDNQFLSKARNGISHPSSKLQSQLTVHAHDQEVIANNGGFIA